MNTVFLSRTANRKTAPLALIGALALLGAVSQVSAAGTISAQSIIVNPVPSPVNVRVWVDRDLSGTSTPNYYVGDRVQIYTTVQQDSFVYLFNVDPNGKVDMIFPNRYSGNQNLVRAGTTKSFPDGPYTFDIAAPYGVNKVLAVASRTRLNMNDIARFQAGQQFATPVVQNQQQLAQALSIVVNPIPQNTWETDTALYNVAWGGGATQAAPVSSSPVMYPWLSTPTWSTSITYTPSTTIGTVYDTYDTQLVGAGYTLVNTRRTNNRIWSEYRSGNDTASLTIQITGGRISVSIQR